jgi:glucokinase
LEKIMLILAADVGGTSTRLAYFQTKAGELEALAEGHYPSAAHASLYEIVQLFQEEHRMTPERACFAIAGPIIQGRVKTPNLPWSIESGELARVTGLPSVQLINDLAANTHGISALKEPDLVVLNVGKRDPSGSIAVVSAGTGLGESFAYWDGTAHRPLPSEAGHADFAPRNDLETRLLGYLQGAFGRVSYERVLSGPGLAHIYGFLRDTGYLPETPALASALATGDPAALIAQAALSRSCPLCSKALDIFVSVYGAECGNAALRFFATGGLYLGGGIAPHIVERLREPGFLEAFSAKGRLESFLESIPVRVILDPRTALLGAAVAALGGD